MLPQVSVTASWLPAARRMAVTPARGAPWCRLASVVPAGQWRISLAARVLPQAQRHLLHAADDQVLVLVATREHHAQDLQHGVGKVRVPAAGAEADLAEHLAVVEGELGEGVGRGDEVVEGAVVPQRHEPVPQGLEARNVALAQRLLQAGETAPSSSACAQACATSLNSGGRSASERAQCV